MNKIKDIFKMDYCIPIYSGTLAIEGLLRSLNLKEETKVLISSISCYSILEAILGANLIPVIATPKNGVLFEKEELEGIIKREKIKIFIAVHQYGYYQELPDSGIILIEDYSQAWDLFDENKKTGDYIIVSLGKTKPLSNGIGGLILTNNNILLYFDFKTRNDREAEIPLIQYVYPLRINEKRLIKIANKKVKKQRKNAALLDKIFTNYKTISTINQKNCRPSYHRYVIGIDNNKKELLITILNESKISYQIEYRKKLNDLPIVKTKKIKTISNMIDKTYILIKPNTTIKSIKQLKIILENKYEES